MPTLLFSAPSPLEVSQTNKNLAVFYTIDGKIEKKYNTLVEKKLKSIGFNVTNPHKRVNDQYEAKYGSTILDVLSFMPIVHDETILPLLNIDPRIAGFAPFNMLIYKKLDENVTHVGHLVPQVMLDILGVENEEVRRKFSSTFKALDTTVYKELAGETSYISYNKLPEKTMIHYEYMFSTPDDLDDFLDEFQNTFELAFINKGYLIAGFHNFMEAADNAEEILSNYDAFWTYSLCHLEFSYNMFDSNQDARPEAGIFAPCTMYMYIKKGSNKVVIGMPRLHNWSDTLNITDKKRLHLVKKLDTEIPDILTALGMKEIPNGNPLLHKTTNHLPLKYEQHTNVSKQTTKPVEYITPVKIEISEQNANVGQVNQGMISAYLRGEFLDVNTIKEKLNSAGFKVVATTPVNKKGDLISIVFSNDALIDMASKVDRGFMASLRVLVDTKDQKISITNPLYMAKGFLQADFDEKEAKNILVQLVTVFPGLINSKDTLKYQRLENYQFMIGMPYYEDMIEVASGDNLLEKIKNNKRVIFTQTLKNGATLIGITLGKRTRNFTKRIGRNNAAMLPYPVLIEKGKAKILDPKYYIAYMYPNLSMSEFMMIATIPGEILKDCEKVFKKE